MNYKMMASTVFGVEAVVAKELQSLGFTVLNTLDGRVFYEADERGIALSNICLRSAERIYIVVGEFEAGGSDQLYDGLKGLPFGDYIEKNAAFPVDVNLVKNSGELVSKSVTQKTAKRAVVDCLRHVHRTESFSEDGAKYHIYVNIIKDKAAALIDTSGGGLNRRGYREYAGIAPLRETLAAAIVQLSGWRTDTKLIDMFCGSGTILIEAALLALGIPPNRERHFPFEDWRMFSGVGISEIREMRTNTAGAERLSIEGYDVDPAVVRQARINASKAGVSEHIHLQVRDMKDFSTYARRGTFISNLPYGERLSDREAVSELNRNLGKLMRGYEGWYKFFLTSHDFFEDEYGQKADKNRKLYNGGIKTRLYSYYAQKNKALRGAE